MKNLHELSTEYAQHLIGRDNYRKSRSALIRGICAGEIEVKTREYLAPIKDLSKELTETERGRLKKNNTISTRLEPKSPMTHYLAWIFKQKNILIRTMIVLLPAIIWLIILLLPTTNNEPVQTKEVQMPKNSVGEILITDFIQQKNWSKNSMESFLLSWQSLSEQNHSVAVNSPTMQRLISAIYRQLLSERALLSLGDVENVITNQQSLINFADELEIDDKRLTVLRP